MSGDCAWGAGAPFFRRVLLPSRRRPRRLLLLWKTVSVTYTEDAPGIDLYAIADTLLIFSRCS